MMATAGQVGFRRSWCRMFILLAANGYFRALATEPPSVGGEEEDLNSGVVNTRRTKSDDDNEVFNIPSTLLSVLLLTLVVLFVVGGAWLWWWARRVSPPAEEEQETDDPEQPIVVVEGVVVGEICEAISNGVPEPADEAFVVDPDVGGNRSSTIVKGEPVTFELVA